jgi:hypothetical protein
MCAAGFFWFSIVNEMVTTGTLVILLACRLAAYGVIGSPNNLTAMRALPEADVVMASGLFSLIRSISGTMGPVVSAALFDQRYLYHVQRYAENNDLTAYGLQEAFTAVQHFLQGAGEPPVLLATETAVLLQQRLLAEATTAAYQEYFLVAALLSVIGILPALPLEKLPRLMRTVCGFPVASRSKERVPAGTAPSPVSMRK